MRGAELRQKARLAGKPRPGRAARVQEALASLVLCGPAVVLYAGFIVLPALLGFAYGLTDWTGWTQHPRFVGLANFRELWSDERFLASVRFTLFETLLIVAFFTLFPLVLAVALDGLRKGRALVRGLFFYPYVLSILVSALLFQYLANYREGAVNMVLRWVGLGAWAQDWMGDPGLVPYFIFSLVAWSGLGFYTTLYLAGLQTIPTELYEAARIDGAGALSIFRRIQLPLLISTMTTCSVLALITGINLFSHIVVTTQGGPGYRTVTIGYYIYWLGVLNNRQGYASAVSFVAFAALLAVAALQVALLRRRAVSF